MFWYQECFATDNLRFKHYFLLWTELNLRKIINANYLVYPYLQAMKSKKSTSQDLSKFCSLLQVTYCRDSPSLPHLMALFLIHSAISASCVPHWFWDILNVDLADTEKWTDFSISFLLLVNSNSDNVMSQS